MGMKSSVVPLEMSDRTLARKIAQVSRDSSRVALTTHAKQRMRQRRILLTQVIKVLQEGLVVEHAHRDVYGSWKCTLEKTVAGDRIKVAAALRSGDDGEMVIVITVMN